MSCLVGYGKKIKDEVGVCTLLDDGISNVMHRNEFTCSQST